MVKRRQRYRTPRQPRKKSPKTKTFALPTSISWASIQALVTCVHLPLIPVADKIYWEMLKGTFESQDTTALLCNLKLETTAPRDYTDSIFEVVRANHRATLTATVHKAKLSVSPIWCQTSMPQRKYGPTTSTLTRLLCLNKARLGQWRRRHG